MSLLVVGTVAFDTIETPFGRADRILGGSATYASLSARLLADPVMLNAVVGADFPDEHIETLRDRGVDLDGLVQDPDGQTFFWAGRYHHDLNTRDTLATHLNVLATFSPDLPAHYRAPRILALGNLDPTIQGLVIDQASEGGAPDLVLADTMNFWIGQTPEALAATLARVDVLLVNDEEARELAGVPNLFKAAEIVRAMGPKTLIIKKGEHGALLFHDEAVFSVPAYPVEDVVDPTGAGDTFLGGLAGHLLRTGRTDLDAMKGAVVIGSALASFVVEAFGPERLLDVTPDQLRERVAAFHAMSAIPQELFV